MGDLIIAPAVQIADAGPGPCARAGRTAVGGKAADARFQMDGDKIRHDERAVELLLARFQLARVDNDGQRRRHALIAAARVDDDRLFAAVHARVRARGSPSLGAVLHAVAIGIEQDFSDGRAVLPCQSCLSDGCVIFDLARDGRADIV